MSRKRKVYSASFRAQVALAAARGDKTVNEIAAQFEVSPQMVLKMKAWLKERLIKWIRDQRERPAPIRMSAVHRQPHLAAG